MEEFIQNSKIIYQQASFSKLKLIKILYASIILQKKLNRLEIISTEGKLVRNVDYKNLVKKVYLKEGKEIMLVFEIIVCFCMMFQIYITFFYKNLLKTPIYSCFKPL